MAGDAGGQVTMSSEGAPTTRDAASLREQAGGVPAGVRTGKATSGGELSITDFLTDGSLPALCAELSRLTGVRVELQDPRGHAVLRVRDAGGPVEDQGSWRVCETPSDLRGEGLTRFPLRVGGEAIGAIVLGHLSGPAPTSPDERRAHVEQVVTLLASTAEELCTHELELRLRIKEVGAMARMSALLTRAASPQKVLDVAMDLALDVLQLDAGSIVLMKESPEGELSPNEDDLTLATSRNLSMEWLERPQPLSKDRLFDRMALAGQVVVSEDIARDDRILLREPAQREGLGAALHVGMVFKQRALGVIRLYSRQPRTFDDAEKKLLVSIASQAAVALEQSRLMALEREEQALQRQLALAADVQRRMLPRSVPNFPNLDLAARYVPSFELGGDFYDFIDLNGHMGVAVGDVVGKGIAAALLMSSVRASLRAFAQDVYDLDEIVGRVNQALCRDTRDHEFASLWYGVIDPHRMRLTYCSAGHEPPMVVRVPKHRAPSPADVDELSVGGMVVGIDPSQRYQRALFDIRPGDVVLAYTDGISDATNYSGERFGKARLREALLRCLRDKPLASAGEIVEHILYEVRQYSGFSRTRSDDKTIVAIRVR